MDTGRLLAVGTLVASSLPLFVLAFLIGIQGKTGLISGHRQGTARDEQGLARWVGGMLAAMGLCMLIFAGLYIPMAAAGQIMTWVVTFCAATMIGSVALIVGIQRYR